MKKYFQSSLLPILIFALICFNACSGSQKTTEENSFSEPAPIPETTPTPQDFYNPGPEDRLMQVVRRVYQDKKGNLWIGGDDLFRYNGKTLDLFDKEGGFNGLVVRRIAEDKEGNIWLGTMNGIVKYDPSASPGTAFTDYTKDNGLVDNDVWSIEIDHNGTIWAGTLGGVSRFDPSIEKFSLFDLPESEPDLTRGVTSERIVHCIMEDSQGKIWFGTNGGAYIYDPVAEKAGKEALTNISEEDGLCNNLVNDILEDKDGNIWFATHHNGVCVWEKASEDSGKKSFRHFTSEDGIRGTEAWSLFEDSKGNIWFPVENDGIYRYNPVTATFTNFSKKDGLPLGAPHFAYEDKDGMFWMGGFGGLFRYDPSAAEEGREAFVKITKDGPWE
ncbi:MAG: hypothetical protein KDE26_18330 [Bacteroidetes bacterium]|nr:hypothetical protein [Bacteroidota bacterium]MCB0845216.1 hypothetical protein [Bacteroidota bacterium]